MVSMRKEVELSLRPLIITHPNGRFAATAHCATEGCNMETTWTANHMPRPEIVRKKIRDRHWSLDDKKATCHKCTEKAREQKREERRKAKDLDDLKAMVANPIVPIIPKETTPVNQPAKPNTSPFPIGPAGILPAPIPSDAAKATKRKAYEILLDAYDVGHKRYNDDWSDHKVSAQSGYALAAVTKLREDDFGPLGMTTEFVEIGKKIEVLSLQLTAARQKIDEILALDETVVKIAAEIKYLRDKHAEIIKQNGW